MIEQLTSAQLVESLCKDQCHRWRTGQQVPVQTYVKQHPVLESDSQCIIELVYNEVLLREELGNVPLLQEYVQLFPHLAVPLGHLFEVHRALEQPAQADAAPSIDTPRGAKPGGLMAHAAAQPAIADYEIEAELGRGGMGIVYKSRQLSLNRPVALKMILAGQLASSSDVARFRAEAEAAAQLDHPHIVPIYEIGEHAGQQYFSMKLVEGGSLALHVERFVQSPLAATRLVATVAYAVHYAHQRGLLHRDLKPANILLDKQGQPHVSDFGLAKRVMPTAGDFLTRHANQATQPPPQSRPGSPPTPATQCGAILGTPGYMAPEQAVSSRGKTSSAADIYSLGAILYELLTGCPPFRAGTPLETIRQLLEGELPRPRSLNPRLDLDLEAICLKCLAKEPLERYPSAQALAEDLERYLVGEPIRARSIGTLERGWRWCRRKPALTMLMASVVLLCVSGIAAVTRERWRAEHQRHRAEAEWERAERNFHQARQAIDNYSALIREDPLINGPAMQPLREKMLHEVLKYYQAFLHQRSDDPVLKAALADAHFRVAEITDLIGSKTEAQAQYEQACTFYEQLIREQPTAADHQHGLAKCYVALGHLHANTGQPDEAFRCHQHALDILQQLLSTNPDNSQCQYTFGKTHGYIGNLHAEAGRRDEAIRSQQQSLAIMERVVAENPDVGAFQYCLAGTYFNVGRLQSSIGEPAKAFAAYRQACDLLLKLAGQNYSVLQVRKDLAFAYNTIGLLQRDVGQSDEAFHSFEQARLIVQELARASPAVTDLQRDLAVTYINLGTLHGNTDKPDEAREYFQSARRTLEKLVGDHPTVTVFQRDLAKCHHQLGKLYSATGQWPAAVESLERAGAILQTLASANQRNVAYQDALGETSRDLKEALCHLNPP